MKRPALYLDRDGIIIHDSGYVREATNVRLIPGIVELIARAKAKGWAVITVTNQSGLGRCWITLEQYQAVSDRMIELLKERGVSLDAVYFCPFYEPNEPGLEELRRASFLSGGIPQQGVWKSHWRKPLCGMLEQAATDHDLDLGASVMVGDRATDAVAGCLAGVKRQYFLTAPTEESEAEVKELEVWRSRLHELSQGKRKAADLAPVLIQHLDEVAIS